MDFPQIRLQQTYAMIGLRTNQPVQELKQEPAQINYVQTPGKLSIERIPGKLDVDAIQAWDELGFKNSRKLTAENAAYAREQVMEGIAQMVDEGNQMAAIETKADAIYQIAQNRALEPPADFNIAFIPSPGSVKLHYQPTELQLEYQRGNVELDVQPAKVIHDYRPGKTEVYLQQRPQLERDFVGLHINHSV